MFPNQSLLTSAPTSDQFRLFVAFCLYLRGFLKVSTLTPKAFSADGNGVDAYPVEVEGNAGYGNTLIVMIDNNSPKKAYKNLAVLVGILEKNHRYADWSQHILHNPWGI